MMAEGQEEEDSVVVEMAVGLVATESMAEALAVKVADTEEEATAGEYWAAWMVVVVVLAEVMVVVAMAVLAKAAEMEIVVHR